MMGLWKDNTGFYILSLTDKQFLYVYNDYDEDEWSIYACMKHYLVKDFSFTTYYEEIQDDLGGFRAPMEFL
jgi:hypothetical protein